MARTRPPFDAFYTYLKAKKLLPATGTGGVRVYDDFKPKRLYERIDGKFVGVGWKIWFYPNFDHRDVQEISILDSAIE